MLERVFVIIIIIVTLLSVRRHLKRSLSLGQIVFAASIAHVPQNKDDCGGFKLANIIGTSACMNKT